MTDSNNDLDTSNSSNSNTYIIIIIIIDIISLEVTNGVPRKGGRK